MHTIKLVVADENILGYIDSRAPYALNIFHASILRGCLSVNTLDGWTCVGSRNIRLATEKDFSNFRVSFSDHYKNKPYEYDRTPTI